MKIVKYFVTLCVLIISAFLVTIAGYVMYVYIELPLFGEKYCIYLPNPQSPLPVGFYDVLSNIVYLKVYFVYGMLNLSIVGGCFVFVSLCIQMVDEYRENKHKEEVGYCELKDIEIARTPHLI